MKKSTIILVCIVAALVGIILIMRFSSPEDTWICTNNAWVKHGNPTAAAPLSGCGNDQVSDFNIKLYFYNPSLDQGVGGAQCGKKGIVAVNRVIPKTNTPLQDSISLLLRGGLSDTEKTQGLTTEFPLAGVVLKSAVINDGVATLTFNDPQHKTSGGSCRAGVLQFQIEATAKQFSIVSVVKFMPEDLFQP